MKTNRIVYLFSPLFLLFSFLFLNIWKGFDVYLLIFNLVAGAVTATTVLMGFMKKGSPLFMTILIFLIVVNGYEIQGKLSYPHRFEKYVYSGDRFYEEKLYFQAIKEYEKALEIDNSNINILEKLTMSLWNNNKIEDAIKTQKRIVSIPFLNREETISHKLTLAALYFVNAHNRFFPGEEPIKPGEDLSWGLDEFLTGKKIIYGPEIQGPFTWRIDKKGILHDVRTRQFSSDVEGSFYECEKLCKQILQKAPQNEPALVLLASMKTIQGAYKEAIEYRKKLVDINRHSIRSLLVLGRLYLNAVKEPYMGQEEPGQILIKNIEMKYFKEIDKIIELLSERETDQKNRNNYLAFIFDTLYEYINQFNRKIIDLNFLGKEIVFLCQRILKKEDKIPLIYFYLGEGYLITREPILAKAQFEKAVSISSNENMRILFETYRELTDVYLDKNKIIKVIESSLKRFQNQDEFYSFINKLIEFIKKQRKENPFPFIWIEVYDSGIEIKFVVSHLI